MATVASTPRFTASTLGSDTAGPFNVGFRLFESDALTVYVNGEKREDWTLTADLDSGHDDAATITFDDDLSSGDILWIEGSMIPERETDYGPTEPRLTDKANAELARIWATLVETVGKSANSLRTTTAQPPVDFEDGAVPMFKDGVFQNGPTADEITAAQGYATAASASASAASDSAGEAALSADRAALYSTARVDTFSDLAGLTASDLDEGDYAQVTETGMVVKRVPSGGDLDYSGSGGVQFDIVLTPSEGLTLGNVSDVLGSTDDWWPEGAIVRTREEGFSYKVAASGATDHHLTTAGGVKLKRVKGFGSLSSAAHFWKRVRGDSTDVHVFIGSDSTGNGATEWPYLWAQYLVGEAPTHTVKLRYWNDGSGSWDVYVTLGAGTGSNTIFIDACAVSGTNSYYLQGGREADIFERSDYVLGILNYGHNLGTNGREETTFHECLIATAHLHWRCPYASIVVTAQNPRTSTNGFGQSMGLGAAWRKVADLTGAGLIDVLSWFTDRTDWAATLMLDETHPNDTGQLIWLDAVKFALAEPDHMDMSVDRAAGTPSLSTVGQNWLSNGLFHDWAAGANPAGWTPTNCTLSKQPGRSDIAKYSMEVTAGASTGTVSQSIPLSKLEGMKGRRVLFLARIWKTSGMSSLAGRIDITSNNGVTSVSGTSRSVGDVSADGWAWVLTSVNVQTDAVSLTATIYSGDGTDSGEKLWVQSAGLFSAAVPMAVSFDRVEDMVIDEYYSPLNVHPKSGSDDGTLTADATSITLTGATNGASSNTVIELPPLDAGATYRFTYDVEPAAIGSGGIWARSAQGGGGSNLSGVGWTQGTTANTLDFTPTTGIASLWLYGSGSTTGYEFTSITIEKL